VFPTADLGFDLLDPRDISIEVKSAAYIQSWHQDRLSTISFNCAPSFAWDPETNRQSDVKRRQAEVYVFALLAHQNQATHRTETSQWTTTRSVPASPICWR
jgi:hypothetical protein